MLCWRKVRLMATWTNIIEYITIASTGNVADFGDLTIQKNTIASGSNGTRGVWGGGRSGADQSINVIDYITIASTGNASDFGDLLAAATDMAGCSDNTKTIFIGGYLDGGALSNVLQYINTASTGNASDFGDLSRNSVGGSCTSGD